MKKTILCCLLVGAHSLQVWADTSLGTKCEAFLPTSFYSSTVIAQKDADAVAKGAPYGQRTAPSNGGRYWVVYSDRDHNVTYSSPSKTSGRYKELNFNDKVRIAKISGDFALVYKEPAEGSQYPNISGIAESMGWIPMSNLLLWSSCPVDKKGIYNKALLVANIDRADEKKDMGKVYKNPETRSGEGLMKTDMNIYFVMKRASNGLVLLAREYSLGGISSQVLYGWVSESSYIKWNQRSCLEPTWVEKDVEYFRGKSVDIYPTSNLSGQRAAHFKFGSENGDPNPATRFRMPREALRFPILDRDVKDTTLYKCTTFGQIGHALNYAVELQKQKIERISDEIYNALQLNLIIVIDGTASMGKYYEPVKEAIRQGSSTVFRDDFTFRVGVVIYRDYADGDNMIEVLPMTNPSEPAFAAFLDNGGASGYGIKSSPKDRTKEEALFQGIKAALDANRLGYRKSESNLMVVIGDCGNDLKDKQVLLEDLVNQLVANNINLMSFQVRRDNIQAYSLFNLQMGDIMNKNIRQQYSNLNVGISPKMERSADGYDLKSDVKRQFFIASERHANEMGKDMETAKLVALIQNSLVSFSKSVQDRLDVIGNGEKLFEYNTDTRDDLEAEVDSAYYISRLGKEFYQQLKETNSMSAFTGYTPKRDKSGRSYWKPIIYISADEFNHLIERLAPVNTVAQRKSDDRKPYVDALKALLKSLLPDLSDAELDQKGVGEVMGLITGLNESSQALKGPKLVDIQDPKAVSHEEYLKLTTGFREKYAKLRNIKNRSYRYALDFNGEKYYWIPLDDMP